jgi:hypothetical protein
MTAASLAKAGPGLCVDEDFLARRGLVLDFLRRRESFLGGMLAFFPEGLTLRRADAFRKRRKERRWKMENIEEKRGEQI